MDLSHLLLVFSLILTVTSRFLHLHFTFTFHFHELEKEKATHSSVLAWRIPGTEEPDKRPSMGSQSRTRLKQLSSSSSSHFQCHFQCLISTLTQGGGGGHFFLGLLVQSFFGEGRTLQTNITACVHSDSATLGLLHSWHVCFPSLHCSVLGCSDGNCLDVGPGLHALPRSKLFRFRFSGTLQRCRLGWACVLHLSQVRAAQVTRSLARVVAPS